MALFSASLFALDLKGLVDAAWSMTAKRTTHTNCTGTRSSNDLYAFFVRALAWAGLVLMSRIYPNVSKLAVRGNSKLLLGNNLRLENPPHPVQVARQKETVFE